MFRKKCNKKKENKDLSSSCGVNGLERGCTRSSLSWEMEMTMKSRAHLRERPFHLMPRPLGHYITQYMYHNNQDSAQSIKLVGQLFPAPYSNKICELRIINRRGTIDLTFSNVLWVFWPSPELGRTFILSSFGRFPKIPNKNAVIQIWQP